MQTENIEIVQVDINELRPSEYNPRMANEKECKDLKTSIKRFGIVDPIIVNSAKERKNIVVGGHFRLRIAKEMGYKTLPVVYVDVPDIKKEQELNIRLNKNNGQFDINLLANIDEDLLKDIGFLSDELDQIFQLDIDDEKADKVPEVRETDIKLGDMFKLGTHRLLCGDAIKKEDAERLLAREKADMVFCDPPYGVEYQGIKNKKEVLKGDKKGTDLFELLYYSLIWNCPQYICCNWQSYSKFEEIMTSNDRKPKACIIWDKGSRIQNLDKFAKQHEFILYWGKFGGEKTVDTDIWKLEREIRKDHPTSKPVELCERAIRWSSNRGDIVLDYFGGSGSTLIACEKTNRQCRMMEISPEYCQVILDRYEEYTGKKAEKIV